MARIGMLKLFGVTVRVTNGLPATYIILDPKPGLCLIVR